MTSCSSFNLQDEPVTYPGDNFGLFPDVNMFDLALSTREPSACVNPLDTMGRMPDSPYYGPPMEGSRTRSPSPSLPANHPPGLPLKEYPLSGVIQDIVSIFAKSEVRESENAVPLVLPPTKRRRTGDRKWIQPSNAATQLPLPTMVPQEFNFPSSPREPPPQAMKDEDGAISFDSAYPSPILNAHHGVPMGELAFRADRYRLRRSVEEIDKAWLMHFAGKLSERGELLQDFRCYVIGCGQTNKRRDHILVHVGAHVDQRPYACSVCSLRFLRKNECTRHEASHSGHRPYSCTLCGQTFVRQDLVTRHLKRTHGIGKENLNHPPRKKAKLQ
ncbi:hypothetical protein BV22DRAFT_1001489 [Leucogyrophana mollusca]|uniref:Uncharacterized protein n=1 Tax=Leucogyrophana mollusca TaxID=85980 RepID=A0ACB8BXC4_9AGAM|nr:hypothetical protein BV22DRAFT_1001489 [Leucogyrophana mollusca]